jgi:hypothetical protein
VRNEVDCARKGDGTDDQSDPESSFLFKSGVLVSGSAALFNTPLNRLVVIPNTASNQLVEPI